MHFQATKLEGVFLIQPERIVDERGFFARTWCQEEFAAHGLETRLVQCNISFNAKRGTLRGMHYQTAPYEEVKLIRCTMGAIYDVVVDVRTDSPSYLQWIGVELTAENRSMLYVDDTEVFYQMSEFYHPAASAGLRWDDPAIGITWPDAPQVISAKDRSYPLINV
jgi:dTDP-4-dehydrorhamnose 3,5-epimerase